MVNQTLLHKVLIPKKLQHRNVFIQVIPMDPFNISTPGAQAFYDHRLVAQIKNRYGRLRVLDQKEMRPIAKAYVKVYAWIGSAKFHKDGYTDRRGQFDYVSVSCDHLASTTKFAILVATKNYGSVVKIVDIPLDLRANATTAAAVVQQQQMPVSHSKKKKKGHKKQKALYKGYGHGYSYNRGFVEDEDDCLD